MKLDRIYVEVAKELGLEPSIVRSAYLGYWEFIRDVMVRRRIPPGLTEEQFAELRPNIQVNHIGKFGVSWRRYQRVSKEKLNGRRKRDGNVGDKCEEGQANVQQDSDNV